MKIYIPKRNNNKADKLEKKIRDSLNTLNYQIVSKPELANFILSIGGDGTLLHNIYVHRNYNIPIVSANGGSVGHHAYINKNSIKKDLMNLRLAKKSSYYFIEAETEDGFADFAAQDIRIERSDHHAIIMKIKEGNKVISKRHLADGIIVSNAFGLTGYNLSAGGIRRKIKIGEIVLTPICPFSSYPKIYDSIEKSRLINKSEIEIIPEKEARLVLDNRAHIIPAGKSVKISISNKYYEIITPNP